MGRHRQGKHPREHIHVALEERDRCLDDINAGRQTGEGPGRGGKGPEVWREDTEGDEVNKREKTMGQIEEMVFNHPRVKEVKAKNRIKKEYKFKAEYLISFIHGCYCRAHIMTVIAPDGDILGDMGVAAILDVANLEIDKEGYARQSE